MYKVWFSMVQRIDFAIDESFPPTLREPRAVHTSSAFLSKVIQSYDIKTAMASQELP
jgi:hypothetical protein